MKSEYYFCYKCGYHTATTGSLRRCPNCHSETDLHSLGSADEAELPSKIKKAIQAFIDKKG